MPAQRAAASPCPVREGNSGFQPSSPSASSRWTRPSRCPKRRRWHAGTARPAGTASAGRVAAAGGGGARTPRPSPCTSPASWPAGRPRRCTPRRAGGPCFTSAATVAAAASSVVAPSRAGRRRATGSRRGGPAAGGTCAASPPYSILVGSIGDRITIPFERPAGGPPSTRSHRSPTGGAPGWSWLPVGGVQGSSCSSRPASTPTRSASWSGSARAAVCRLRRRSRIPPGLPGDGPPAGRPGAARLAAGRGRGRGRRRPRGPPSSGPATGSPCRRRRSRTLLTTPTAGTTSSTCCAPTRSGGELHLRHPAGRGPGGAAVDRGRAGPDGHVGRPRRAPRPRPVWTRWSCSPPPPAGTRARCPRASRCPRCRCPRWSPRSWRRLTCRWSRRAGSAPRPTWPPR